MSAPVPNYEASWQFLQTVHPGRLVTVTCISLDKKQLPTETFDATEKDKFLKWIAAGAAMPANCYYSLAEPLGRFTKKMERTDCKAVHYFHVDLDPRAGEDIAQEQARILAMLRDPPGGLPKPTCIVYSGGGYQALWKLSEPLPVDGRLETAEDLKLYNLQIERILGGDNCHDISRILRVPGTINEPDAGKVKRGRVPAMANVVEWHADRVYPLSAFTKAVQTPKAAPDAPTFDPFKVQRLRHIDDLGPGVSDTIKQEIVSGPLDPVHWKFSESRNEWQHWVVCELVRAGVDDATIYAVLTDRNFKISDTIFKQHDGTPRPNPEKYAQRQIINARSAVGVVKPQVFVPSAARQYRECAAELGPLLRANGIYRRGRLVMAPGPDGQLEPVKGKRSVTLLEQVATFMAWKEEKGSKALVPAPTLLSDKTAAVLIESDELIEPLPRITVVSRWPLLIEEGGQLVKVTGYHEPTGVYVLPGTPDVPEVPIDEAATALLNLLCDFRFVDDADKARAVLAIIKPGLNASGMLRGGRVPFDVIEKDQSQAGGGFLAKIIHATYRTKAATIGQTSGGVGSVREAIHTKLIEGHQFIQLDNWKGRLNEPALEIALTEDSVDCRMPGVKSVVADPRQTCFLMTSNGAELTEDLANRSNIIRILKQPEEYSTEGRWRDWPEGGLVAHVEANQPYYLGCVFAVLRRWHDLGKPLAEDNGQHDFRAWARAARSIAQGVLGLADPLAEYRKVQRQKSTASMAWIRKVVLAAVRAGRMHRPMRAGDVLDLIREVDEIEIPGIPAADRHSEDEAIKRKALQGIGRALGGAFGGALEEDRGGGVWVRTIDVDGVALTRVQSPDPHDGTRSMRTYIVGEFGDLPDYGAAAGEGGTNELPF